MTASEKAAVKSAQKASFGKVFAVQIAAYVVLLLSCVAVYFTP